MGHRGNVILIVGIMVGCLCLGAIAADDPGNPGISDTQSPEIESILKDSPTTPWKGYDNSKGEPGEPGNLLGQFALSIGLVLLLGATAYYLSRKFGARLTAPRGRHIRVIESIAVGANRQIHLVEVGGRRLLVGSAPQSIGLIADVGDVSESAEGTRG